MVATFQKNSLLHAPAFNSIHHALEKSKEILLLLRYPLLLAPLTEKLVRLKKPFGNPTKLLHIHRFAWHDGILLLIRVKPTTHVGIVNARALKYHRCNPLESETGRLGRKSVGLSAKRRGRGPALSGTSGDHEAVHAQDGGVVILGLLGSLLGLASLVVSLEGGQLLGLLAEEVDHVRHSEVMEAVAPRELQDKIGADEVVAGIKHADVALPVANVDELRRVC